MSYDNNDVFISKLYGDIQTVALHVLNIDNADSPVTTTLDDAVFIGDASLGSINVMLNTANNILPNQSYIIKKSDISDNAVNVIPPIGETIDGSASLSLIGQNQVVQIVKNGTNWEIINNSFDLNAMLGEKGVILTSDGSGLTLLSAGTSGYVLISDPTAPNGIRWSGMGASGEVNSGENIGTGAGLIFKDKPSLNLRLRTIKGVGDISVSTGTDEINIGITGTSETISSSAPVNPDPDITITQFHIDTSGTPIVSINLGPPTGAVVGTRKILMVLSVTGTDTLRITTPGMIGASSIDFIFAGMSVQLIWSSSGWVSLGGAGAIFNP